jgi:Zn-dependent protease with chaperone function
MFFVRGLAVSIAIFVILYGALSAVVCALWRRIWFCAQGQPARRCADLLFGLRIFPLAVATATTLALAIPSFLLLEPRNVIEPLGWTPVLLSLGGILVFIAGGWKAAEAWIRSSLTVARWRGGAFLSHSNHDSSRVSGRVSGYGAAFETQVYVLQSAGVPPLLAAGIVRPTVWLSQAAARALTESELQVALRHEFVHVASWDNLKKLILRVVAFPGMSALEKAWREATEMAADDAAVTNAPEALDLATAVIRLSRLDAQQAPELSTALIDNHACLNARVARLIAWRERGPVKSSRPQYLLCVVAVLAMLALTYHALLIQAHAATEWLVR